jgi:CheY-like chemotaxis protein
MLVIFGARPARDLWRQGVGLASVPIEIVEANTAASACALLARGGIDIVVLDSALPDAANVAKTARAATPSPFVVAAAPANNVAAGRIDGADGVIAKPASVEEARDQVERCIRVKVPTRVLIVDDSGTMRSIVRKILSASRYALKVSEAEEGIAALAQMKTGNFDMVFLDYNMPGLNGLETLSEIKRENPRVAVVMITSTVDSAIADRALAAGAAAFLKKPFFPKDIDAVLERFYGLHAQGR